MNDIDESENIKVYKSILNGDTEKFPSRYWKTENAKEKANELMIYLFEKVLVWDRNAICKNLDSKVFVKYKLKGMFHTVFGMKTFDALDSAYPNEFKPWELKVAPMNYWNFQTAEKATIWFLEEKLKWSIAETKNKIRYDIFIENGLRGMLAIPQLKDSPYLTLVNAYRNVDWSDLKTKY